MPRPKKKDRTLVDRLLAVTKDSRQPISVYLVNGFQLKGEVVEFDEESMLINHKNVHQFVMRSGVASMYPLSGARQNAGDWWQADAAVPESQSSADLVGDLAKRPDGARQKAEE
jgi:RNA chaperone Hfq